MNAYVLVQTDGNTDPIAPRLKALPGVVFAEDVRGPYDALALARSDQDELAWTRSWPRSATCPG